MHPAIGRSYFNTLRQVRRGGRGCREQLQAETNEQLSQHFQRTPGDLEELAFDLLNRAWADAMAEDIVPRIIKVKNVGLAEPDYIEEDLRGMKAYWQGKGGQIRSDIIRYERAQMPREEMVAAIDLHDDEISTNFWGTFEKLITQAREKMGPLPVERLLELVQASITAGATFGTFAAARLTDNQIDPIIEEVALRSGGHITIIGTRRDAAPRRDRLGIRQQHQGKNLQHRPDRRLQGLPGPPDRELRGLPGRLRDPERRDVGRRATAPAASRTTGTSQGAAAQAALLHSRWETARDAGMLLYGVDKGRLGRIILT